MFRLETIPERLLWSPLGGGLISAFHNTHVYCDALEKEQKIKTTKKKKPNHEYKNVVMYKQGFGILVLGVIRQLKWMHTQ